MKRNTKKPLALARETLRLLSNVALVPVAAGAVVNSKTNDGAEAQCGPSTGGCDTAALQRRMM